MPRLQWPIKRTGSKASTMEASETVKDMEIKAGLMKVHGTEDLASRILFTDEYCTNIIGELQKEIAILLHKKDPTPADKEMLEQREAWLVNWETLRLVKKSSTAWLTAGEDRDMSERMRAFEIYFTRNWQDPWQNRKIVRFGLYLHDISFKLAHVEPAPVIVVQSIPKGSSINLGQGKEENID